MQCNFVVIMGQRRKSENLIGKEQGPFGEGFRRALDSKAGSSAELIVHGRIQTVA
jgi:hypothetical protein